MFFAGKRGGSWDNPGETAGRRQQWGWGEAVAFLVCFEGRAERNRAWAEHEAWKKSVSTWVLRILL